MKRGEPPMSMALELAPTGMLRIGVWMVPYFARDHAGDLRGIIPDLGAELARRAGVTPVLMPFESPSQILAAFRSGALDVTFLGITADRAEAIDFGLILFALQTTYLVPAASEIASIAEIDRIGIRIAVPARSAQETHLRRTIAAATLHPIPAEEPQRAIAMLATGEADAFSHVAPMLAAVQGDLPGSRILAGSYFDVPVAIGVAKGRPPAAEDFARAFAADVKQSGFLQEATNRAGVTGITVVG